MKAIIFTKYGASDVLQLTEVAKRNLAMASGSSELLMMNGFIELATREEEGIH